MTGESALSNTNSRRIALLLAISLPYASSSTSFANAAEPAASKPAETKPASSAVGIMKRVPWTTSRITGSPEPPLPYDVEQVFPNLKFDQPVDIVMAPGTNRFFVVEQAGKVFSFPNDPNVKSADLILDTAKEIAGVKQVYAIAFHPKFAENRYCYLCCIRDAEQKDGTRILRFRVSESDPPRIDPKSEQVVITWLSGGHNGCCLKFGPDGYLYISTGDGAGPNPPDTLQTGQDVGDLLSSMLRIDVDGSEDGRNYRIPPDNPFVGQEGARPEIWAYGFRNPWRMSFDRKSGDLWVGDVGWELWELLIRVERGGNYGWAVMEGRQPTNPEWPRGPTPILAPTIDHPHSESSSITGGPTYYGSRLPELHGQLLYGDYDTGKIWGLRWENGKVAAHKELADTTLRIVGFGEDEAGEVVLLHHIGGTIHRLIPNPDRERPSTFPRRLSESGLFTSVADQTPAPGVLPYSINAEQWEDGAVAERFAAIPGEAHIDTTEANWKFPKDSVLAKTLSVPVELGPRQQRRMETQLLHYNGIEWRAYTYAWNNQQTDAELIDASGEDRPYSMLDTDAPGGMRKRTWHFASRTECLRCHNPWSGSALAFQLPQLNRDHDYGGQNASQLETFFHIGLCTPSVPQDKRPALADPRNISADLEQRARAYLHVNCAHCHRMHAGSAVLSKMQYDLPLDQTTMVGYRPTQGDFGIAGVHVIAPGDPYRSALLYRVSKIGTGRMPHIGSQMVDPVGVALLEDWIASLPSNAKTDAPVSGAVLQRVKEEAVLLDRLKESNSPTPDSSAAVEQLLSTTSGALRLLRAVDRQLLSQAVSALAVEKGAQHASIPVRDLFEKHLPEEKRIMRLGTSVRPEQILNLTGDVESGRRLFFETASVQCKNCHRVQNAGKELGPDLTQIGKKYSREQLLESILEPSKFIDPKFVTYVVETKSGRLHTGLLVKKDGKEVVLKDVEGKLIPIAAAEVERIAGQRASLMPELQVRDLTAQQAADLISYLSSLK